MKKTRKIIFLVFMALTIVAMSSGKTRCSAVVYLEMISRYRCSRLSRVSERSTELEMAIAAISTKSAQACQED